MKFGRSTWPTLVILVVILGLVAGACGSNGDSEGSDTVAGAADETDGASASNDQGDDAASSGSATEGDPVGTATIDGTEYTIVASLQCLVALDQANQISISGDVEEYESDQPYEWQYDWDSDDGYNEFTIRVGDDPADEYRAMGTFSDPVVVGESVTASGTVLSEGVDSFDASFEIDCAS